jgi:hypothetical protein
MWMSYCSSCGAIGRKSEKESHEHIFLESIADRELNQFHDLSFSVQAKQTK